jgi:hypothetical protein
VMNGLGLVGTCNAESHRLAETCIRMRDAEEDRKRGNQGHT